MDTHSSRCPGCGLERARGTLAYEGYFHASPECWSVFCDVLAAQFQDPALYDAVHQLAVDAYAVQHAGGAHPDKSVCIHLVGLHLVLVRGLRPVEVPPRLHQVAHAVPEWPHLEPPAARGAPSVALVAAARSRAEHAERVRAWANGQWDAWAGHHAAVARLAERCFEGSRSGG